ncbi:putative orf31 [Pseudomonas aeruginosa]|nr:hypothetical protein PSA83_04841 [Pseudomonas aeruginosa]SCY40377.1 Uncharacterised protein [Acinetobacter baumannii]AVK22989.1 putative orf31 [Pseudomonas aeruginosa]OKN77148.1 hypothetical protein AM433_000905 [Pseudomonas aeruginosa]OKO13422.1 hypothetical protein AM487_000648 [Pseudomonas aeruginosa]
MDNPINPIVLTALLICLSQMSEQDQLDLLRLACALRGH